MGTLEAAEALVDRVIIGVGFRSWLIHKAALLLALCFSLLFDVLSLLFLFHEVKVAMLVLLEDAVLQELFPKVYGLLHLLAHIGHLILLLSEPGHLLVDLLLS
jgi:hypothetical protein